jgi:hypothetical protein
VEFYLPGRSLRCRRAGLPCVRLSIRWQPDRYDARKFGWIPGQDLLLDKGRREHRHVMEAATRHSRAPFTVASIASRRSA